MDRSYIEKYKSEMMKLYGRCSTNASACEKTEDIPKEFISPEIEDINKNAPDDTAYEEHPQADRDESEDMEDEFNQRYPSPDLSDLDTDSGTLEPSENDTAPVYDSEAELGDSTGYIQANVRTGDESSPVEGAAVSVIAVVDGQRIIIASGLTDQNGTTPKFVVPVPDREHSQSPDANIRPYSLYDVTVTAEGYFTARSVDVPVFSGITSVQNFNMIPVPYMMNENSETLTYYNSESYSEEGSE